MDPSAATRVLRIDGMHDRDCEARVRAALRGVAGVATESIRVGGATIRCDGRAASAAACAAINAAGFRAWETRPVVSRNARPPGAPPTPPITPAAPDSPPRLPAAERGDFRDASR